MAIVVPVDIQALLAQPEGKTLEFKQDLSSLQPILKTIVAFANTAGSVLIIGRDNNGQLLGVSDPLKEEERLANTIAENIKPTLLPEISIVTVNKKHLLVVDVHYCVGPYYLKQLGKENGVFIRLGSSNRGASPEIIDAINRIKTQQSYDQDICHGSNEKGLDKEKLRQTFQTLNKKPTVNKLQLAN